MHLCVASGCFHATVVQLSSMVCKSKVFYYPVLYGVSFWLPDNLSSVCADTPAFSLFTRQRFTTENPTEAPLEYSISHLRTIGWNAQTQTASIPSRGPLPGGTAAFLLPVDRPRASAECQAQSRVLGT